MPRADQGGNLHEEPIPIEDALQVCGLRLRLRKKPDPESRPNQQCGQLQLSQSGLARASIVAGESVNQTSQAGAAGKIGADPVQGCPLGFERLCPSIPPFDLEEDSRGSP